MTDGGEEREREREKERRGRGRERGREKRKREREGEREGERRERERGEECLGMIKLQATPTVLCKLLQNRRTGGDASADGDSQ